MIIVTKELSAHKGCCFPCKAQTTRFAHVKGCVLGYSQKRIKVPQDVPAWMGADCTIICPAEPCPRPTSNKKLATIYASLNKKKVEEKTREVIRRRIEKAKEIQANRA